MKKNQFNQSVHKNEKTKFQIPTLEQVKEVFQIKGVNDQKQPLLFMAHYESNGWFVGKSKMRSWRGAIAGWILRMDTFAPQNQPQATQAKPIRQYTPKEADEIAQIQRAYKNQRK